MESCPIRICHPNRDTAGAKTTKASVIMLLLSSAALTTVLLLVSWNQLSGMRFIQVAFVLVYLGLAVTVAQWRCGALPLSAAVGTIMAILALVAAPGWFGLDRNGFSQPSIGSDAVGSLTLLLAAIQIVLIADAIYAFRQRWNVEVEVPVSEGLDATSGFRPAAAS